MRQIAIARRTCPAPIGVSNYTFPDHALILDRSLGEPWLRAIRNLRSDRFVNAGLDGFRRRGRHLLSDGGEFRSLPGENFKLLPHVIVG